jgi:hypothetical protein
MIDHFAPAPAEEPIEQPVEPVEEPIAESPPPPPPQAVERLEHPGWVTAEATEPEETRTKGPPPAASTDPVVAIETTPEPAEDPTPSLGRVRLGGGSGWLRSVAVSAQALEEDSALSYTLGPTSLFELGAEIVIPGIGLGTIVDLGLRPVRYSIDTGTGDTSDPRGLIFDMFTMLIYRLGFGSNGLALLPQVGARVSLATIEEHPQDIIPATTTVALLGGLALRIPIGDLLEVEAGGHGGWIPVYSERPTDTGRSKGGFTAGGHLAVRFWLIAGIGISLDNRIGFDRLSFEEKPTRGVPPDEVDALENASLGLFELKSTLAVTYRF